MSPPREVPTNTEQDFRVPSGSFLMCKVAWETAAQAVDMWPRLLRETFDDKGPSGLNEAFSLNLYFSERSPMIVDVNHRLFVQPTP